MRVLVSSSFPERLNRNVSIVGDLSDGFAAQPGVEVSVGSFVTAEAQIYGFEPALVVMVGSAMSGLSDYQAVSRACRKTGAVFAYWTVEDPYEFDFNYKFADVADVVFSNDAWARRFYSREVHHLPTAASPRRLREVGDYGRRSLDIFFCGVGFRNRQILIQNAMPILEQHQSRVVGENWVPDSGGIVTNRRVSDEKLTEYYASSKLVLNIGRTYHLANERRALPAVTPGPRTFDAAMTGCVQLYHSPSRRLGDYFVPSEEVVAFETVEELGSVVEQLLADPGRAETIARAAQTRALADHTYENRAGEILRRSGLTAD